MDYDPDKDYSKDCKVLLIDLDGTLCRREGRWEGIERIGEPLKGAKEFLETLKELGFRTVLYTTRLGGDNVFGERDDEFKLKVLEIIRKWLKTHGMDLLIDDILPGKPLYHLQVDDRTIRFKGDFEKTLKELKGFKEWWKDKT